LKGIAETAPRGAGPCDVIARARVGCEYARPFLAASQFKPPAAEVLDLTRDERGNAVIEFDLVKVVVSFEVLGLLYAMIYSLEAAEDDRGSERANRH
jgi:hypothetical protein